MSLSRKCAVVGAYEHPTRFAPDKTMYQIMAESVRGALDDCGLTIKDVDGLLTAGMGMGAMAIVGFCDYLNLTPNFRRFDQYWRLLVRRSYGPCGRRD